MRKIARLVVLSLLGLLSTAVLGAMTALMAAVSLAATALIVPGTGTPNANVVGNYMPNFRDYYMQETECTAATSCDLDGVNYYASFWPLPLPGWCDPGRCEKFDVSVADGVDNLKDELLELQQNNYQGDVVIAGYSQGARVVSIAKTKIANGEWAGLIDQLDEVEFVFIGNPNRPNGGILSRFGILGTIPIVDVTTGQPTPTDTVFETQDWAIRWEGIADFPQYLFNPLAVVNSLLGFYYDHGTYLAVNDGSDPGELPAGYTVAEWKEITTHPELYPEIVQIQKMPGSDTTYYTVTPKVLPLVRPLHAIPFLGKPIADLLEPALRVLIEETGYNRNIPFGQYTPIELFPLFNPVTLILKLVPAIFQGINNFLANFGLATEIPLTPPIATTTVSPLSDPETDDLGRVSLLSELEDSSGAKPSLVQENGEGQQPEGEEKTVVLNVEPEEQVTLTEVIETPVIETPVIETPVIEETVLEETVLEQTQSQGNDNTGLTIQDPQEVNRDPEEIKDPEETKVPEETKDLENEDPEENEDPINKPEPGPDAQDAKDAKNPEPAAA